MTSTDALRENILAAARRSKDASRTIGLLTTSQKNTILRTAAAALHERADEILAANQKDIDDARSRGTSDAMIDRLALDSARIDGASELKIWRSIMLPLALPTIAAFSILEFVAYWNSFLWARIMLPDKNQMPLSAGLLELSGTFSTNSRAVRPSSASIPSPTTM